MTGHIPPESAVTLVRNTQEQESETGLFCDEIVSAYSSPADKGLVIQLKEGRLFHEDYCLAYQPLQELPAFQLYPLTSDLTLC